MKLSECTLGVLVQLEPGKMPLWRKGRVGHIVGLTLNAQDVPQVIPVVKWAAADHVSEKPIGIHPSNLVLFKD